MYKCILSMSRYFSVSHPIPNAYPDPDPDKGVLLNPHPYSCLWDVTLKVPNQQYPISRERIHFRYSPVIDRDKIQNTDHISGLNMNIDLQLGTACGVSCITI